MVKKLVILMLLSSLLVLSSGCKGQNANSEVQSFALDIVDSSVYTDSKITPKQLEFLNLCLTDAIDIISHKNFDVLM